MGDVAINEVTLDLRYFKPLKVTERFGGGFYTILNGVFEAGFRGADNLGDAVNMVAHVWSPVEISVRLTKKRDAAI
jgi:hypothetical protein